MVAHGDVEGVENVRRSIVDWLSYMHLVPAGPLALLDRYIGYWEPYATSHDALGQDEAVQKEVRNAARTFRGIRRGPATRRLSTHGGTALRNTPFPTFREE